MSAKLNWKFVCAKHHVSKKFKILLHSSIKCGSRNNTSSVHYLRIMIDLEFSGRVANNFSKIRRTRVCNAIGVLWIHLHWCTWSVIDFACKTPQVGSCWPRSRLSPWEIEAALAGSRDTDFAPRVCANGAFFHLHAIIYALLIGRFARARR